MREPGPAKQQRQGVTWRAIWVAVLLMPFQAWWIIQMEVVSYTTWPTMLSLPLHTVFLLLLLVAGNAVLKRRAPRWILSSGELLTIYLMLAIASTIVGYGFLQSLIGWIITPAWRATPENNWDSLFNHYFPNWLVLKNEGALRPLFEGRSTLFKLAHLQAWAVPSLAWGGFSLALFVAMLSLNTLLRRRWIEEERLTFPLVQLPLAIAEPTGRLFRNRLMWIGFGTAATLGLLNGLHFLFPAIPSFQPTMAAANSAFQAPPWNAMLNPDNPLHPPYAWAIGVGILMPLDISFSYWFFFWLMKMVQVLTVVWGMDVTPEAPFLSQQSAGALLAIGVYALWSARRHLAKTMLQALRPTENRDDGNGPLPPRGAVALLILSVAFLAAFAWRAGAPFWLAPLFLVFYLSAAIALSRLRAELGAPANEIGSAGPHSIITQLVGPAVIHPRALSLLTLLGWPSQSYGNDPTPLQMEGYKIAEHADLRTRPLVGAMVIAAAAGIVIGFIAFLAPIYRIGEDSAILKGYQVWDAEHALSRLQEWVSGAAPPDHRQGLAMGGGALFSIFLYAMRSRFLQWPFHPLGYVMAPTWWTHRLWFSIFIAWVIKLVLLRYGGMRAYAKALPFFFGLILGDCVIGSFWSLVNLVFGVPTFSVWMPR